jgi:hypothetical protein
MVQVRQLLNLLHFLIILLLRYLRSERQHRRCYDNQFYSFLHRPTFLITEVWL